ncbi:MAG: glycine cleavage system aminomethyltransferase GcvT, partial [Spirochaetales bacterium]
MNKTQLNEKHVSLGAVMVDFADWHMPLHYPAGIIEEHCATRRSCGLFDISHMGRLLITGAGSLSFLQHVLTGNAGALEPGKAQYTMLPDGDGGAFDDAYLYCLEKDRYLLVVNAANKDKDLKHLLPLLPRYREVQYQDITGSLAMLSIQGPESRRIFLTLFGDKVLPEAGRNNLSIFPWKGAELIAARTGYTGEPLGFELFVPKENADILWDALTGSGAFPVGLGARDTLRLEAGLPLYGHELGLDAEGKPIPIFACPLSRFAVSFNPGKGGFIGREALERQFEDYRNIVTRHFDGLKFLPRIVRFFYMLDRGIARQECRVFSGGVEIGWVTSGTSVPFLKFEGEGLEQKPGTETGQRSLGMALIDANIEENAEVEIEVRGKMLKALIVPYHLRSEAYPFSRPILYGPAAAAPPAYPSAAAGSRATAGTLLSKAIVNTTWRQKECINLIPSEMTQSPLV